VEVDSSTEPINPGELQRAGVEWGFEQVGRPGQGGDVAASTWGLVSRWMGGGVGRKRCWCDPKKTCRAAKAHLSDDAQAGVGQGVGMGDAWAGVGVGGEELGCAKTRRGQTWKPLRQVKQKHIGKKLSDWKFAKAGDGVGDTRLSKLLR